MSEQLIQKIEAEARRYAEMYQPHSDGRNTFVIFADWVASQSASQHDEIERLREALRLNASQPTP